MSFTGDRDSTLVAMVTARAWRDPAFRDRLVTTPKALLAEEGLEFPEDLEVVVLEDTPSVKYINLARDTTDAKQALDILQRVIPVRAGHEVRIVQSTESTRYLVLPVVPAGISPELMTETDLTRAAVKADAVTVTAFEVQTASTTTTAVAEAEVVAVVVLT